MFSLLTDQNSSLRALSRFRSMIPLGIFLLPLALLTAILVGGCDFGPSDQSQTDQDLEPGGVAQTEIGIRLLASQGGLEKTVTVSAQEGPDPTAETPLPEETSAASPFYRVSGGRNIDLSSQEPPLYLAFPVPEDANMAQLALGIRVPGKYTTGPDASSPEYGWDLVRGAYEPERNLLVVPARFLVTEGIVFTVVQHPNYTSPSMEGTSGETLFEKTMNFFSGEATPKRSESRQTNKYKIKCRGFSGGGCGSDEKNDVRQYLKEVYPDFVPGFREPDLRSPWFSNKYVWIIKKKGTTWCKGQTYGKYLSLTNKAITCYNGNGDPSEGTTRHEFFHAIQYNYAPISWSKLPKQRPDWVIEGTADIAESSKSNASRAFRSSGGLRTVDTPLTKSASAPNFPEYKAKDFWVYLIRSRNSTPADILEPVFKQQSNAPNKPTAEKVDKLYSLADDHEAWVRNQAFESQVTAGYDGALSDQCVFDPATASPKTITYDINSDSEKNTTVDVSPLTAKVVKVELKYSGGGSFGVGNAEAGTSASNGYAKAYGNPSSATSDCTNGGGQDSSAFIQRTVGSGGKKIVYLLLSNGGRQGQIAFDLSFTIGTLP